MKQPEIGELFVGAYLRIVRKCPIIQYNVFDTTEGAQGEIDVLGLNQATQELFVCEVVTHLDGAQYSKRVDGKVIDHTVDRLRAKFARDHAVTERLFPQLREPVFMLWSPYVALGSKTSQLTSMKETWTGRGRFELWINDRYSEAMEHLIDHASKETKQRGELFYRALQLLTHLRGNRSKRLRLRLQ